MFVALGDLEWKQCKFVYFRLVNPPRDMKHNIFLQLTAKACNQRAGAGISIKMVPLPQLAHALALQWQAFLFPLWPGL